MPITVILAIAALISFAACVNGYLGATFTLFMWVVLLGMVRQQVAIPGQGYTQITQYTWAPHLLLPLTLFLIFWQRRLRGRIGPRYGVRDLMRRRRAGYA